MPPDRSALRRAAARLPPHAWFVVSAVFHYLGPSFAVLLFPAVGVLGVAWFRIATAAIVFAPVTRPWRRWRAAAPRERLAIVALGVCLAAMNTSFYLALDRLPMGLVAAMEFVGTLGVALCGLRTRRNALALGLAVIGVVVLIDVGGSSDPVGLAWSVLNAALFAGYIVLGHRAAAAGAGVGIGRLGAAMAVAFALLMPIGFAPAVRAFATPELVLAGIGVGICSSVVPYVCDQLAMAHLPRASFAVLLALLPATAVVVAAIVLVQIPTATDLVGVALVMAGIALHRPLRGG